MLVGTNLFSEEFTFKSDTLKMMDLLVNSLYPDRDIFLRELISNGNDALEKLKYLGLLDQRHLHDSANDTFNEFSIYVQLDEHDRIIYIYDTGNHHPGQKMLCRYRDVRR